MVFGFWALVIQSGKWVRVMVFNATFNNISVISWRSVLLVGETLYLNPALIPMFTNIRYWVVSAFYQFALGHFTSACFSLEYNIKYKEYTFKPDFHFNIWNMSKRKKCKINIIFSFTLFFPHQINLIKLISLCSELIIWHLLRLLAYK